jgi:hypothetical protein
VTGVISLVVRIRTVTPRTLPPFELKAVSLEDVAGVERSETDSVVRGIDEQP